MKNYKTCYYCGKEIEYRPGHEGKGKYYSIVDRSKPPKFWETDMCLKSEKEFSNQKIYQEKFYPYKNILLQIIKSSSVKNFKLDDYFSYKYILLKVKFFQAIPLTSYSVGIFSDTEVNKNYILLYDSIYNEMFIDYTNDEFIITIDKKYFKNDITNYLDTSIDKIHIPEIIYPEERTQSNETEFDKYLKSIKEKKLNLCTNIERNVRKLDKIDIVRKNLAEENKDNAGITKDIISSLITLSKYELDEILQRMEEVGRIGEEMVVKYEKQKLEYLGLINESKLVKKVSEENVTLGFDVQSYEAYKDGSKSIFIEVKTTEGNRKEFYISKNELDEAGEKGEDYYIYRIRNIVENKKFQIGIIKNPFKIFNEDKDNFELIPIKYKVCYKEDSIKYKEVSDIDNINFKI